VSVHVNWVFHYNILFYWADKEMNIKRISLLLFNLTRFNKLKTFFIFTNLTASLYTFAFVFVYPGFIDSITKFASLLKVLTLIFITPLSTSRLSERPLPISLVTQEGSYFLNRSSKSFHRHHSSGSFASGVGILRISAKRTLSGEHFRK